MLSLVLACGIASGWTFESSTPAVRVEVSNDGHLVAAKYKDRVDVIRDGKIFKTFEDKAQAVDGAMTLSQDGRFLGVAQGSFFKIVELATNKEIEYRPSQAGLNRGYIYRAAFSPDSRRFYFISGTLYHNWVCEYDIAQRKITNTLLDDVDMRALTLRFSPNGRYLAVDLPPGKGFSGSLALFDLRTHRVVATYWDQPNAFDFDASGKRLQVMTNDAVSFLSPEPVAISTQPYRKLPEILSRGRAGGYQFVPGTDWIAFAGASDLFVISPKGDRKLLSQGEGEIANFAFSPSGQFAAVNLTSGRLRVVPVTHIP